MPGTPCQEWGRHQSLSPLCLLFLENCCEERGNRLRVCVCVCVQQNTNLCTDFSLNAWTLSGLRAEWLRKAVDGSGHGSAPMCSSGIGAEFCQCLGWRGRNCCPQTDDSLTARFSLSQQGSCSQPSAPVSLGQVRFLHGFSQSVSYHFFHRSDFPTAYAINLPS